MEQEIFSWESWDELGDQILQFNRCTFKKDFGPFESGNNVSSITIEYSTGKIEVFLDDEDNDPIFTGMLRFELI